MKLNRLRYDLNLLIAAIAVSVLCHVVFMIVISSAKNKTQEPRSGGRGVLTASFINQAKLSAATIAKPPVNLIAQGQASPDPQVGGAAGGGSVSVRGSPWRRSSGSIERSYGLMSMQGKVAQQHKEQLYLAAKSRSSKELGEFMQALSVLQTAGVCQITLSSEAPVAVVCDKEVDSPLVLGVLASLTNSFHLDQPITIVVRPDKSLEVK